MNRLRGVFGAGALALLVSCVAPFDAQLATQVRDANGPTILLESPAPDAPYGRIVTIRGSVDDADGSIEGLRLTVPALELDQPVEIGADGTFVTEFSTEGFSWTITYTLTAVDWNGNETTLTRRVENDLTGPHVTITEPEDFSAYGTVVRVTGVIEDAEDAGTTTEVRSASYAVAGTALSGSVELDDSGAFSFELATRDTDGTPFIEGSASLVVTAEDYNGNVTTEVVTLVRAPTGDFASVTVTPGNRQVRLEWDDVLAAESYSIFESRYGETRSNVSSPYTWTDLENGEIYRFQIRAEVPDERGDDAFSTLIEKMPLSERSLIPRVTERAYRSMTLEWVPVDNADEYIVERARDPDGPWTVRRNLTARSFTEYLDDDRSGYWYRLRAFEYPDLASDAVYAAPDRFGADVTTTTHVGPGVLDAAVAGGTAYLASPEGELIIVDVSDPERPVLRQTLDLSPGTPRATSVTSSGSFVFVTLDGGQLVTVPVADPAAPGTPQVTDFADVGDAEYLVIDGNTGYMPAQTSGLARIDLTDPLNPSFLDRASRPGGNEANDVVIVGDYAFVANGEVGIYVVDLQGTWPDDNSEIDTTSLDGNAGDGSAEAVELLGDHLVIANGTDGLVTLDVSNPASPGTPNQLEISGEEAIAVAVDRDRAYVGLRSGAIAVVSLADPSSPVVIERISAEDRPFGLTVSDGRLFVADGGAGLTSIDISAPSAPQAHPGVSTANVLDVVVRDTALFAATASGLTSYSVTDPSTPSGPVGAAVSGSIRGAVVISGDYAYLTLNDDFSVVDVSDPRDPRLVSTVPLDVDLAFGLDVVGTSAYIATSNQSVDDGDLIIVDIADPEAPGAPVAVNLGAPATSVVVRGGYAYLGTLGDGLTVIDVSNPLAPGPPVSVVINDSFAVDVSGSYAYVTTNSSPGALAVVDISDPANPSHVATESLGGPGGQGRGVDVVVSGDYAYVAAGDEGLAIVNIVDPTDPSPPLWVPLAHFADRVTVQGTYAYVSGDDSVTPIELFAE